MGRHEMYYLLNFELFRTAGTPARSVGPAAAGRAGGVVIPLSGYALKLKTEK